MNNYTAALLVLPLVGCMGIDQKFTNARQEWAHAVDEQARTQSDANEDLRETVSASFAELAAGLKTLEAHTETVEEASEERDATIGESFDLLQGSVARTWDDLRDGVEAEIDTVKATATTAAGGLLGGGPLWDLLAAAATGLVGANVARNRSLPGTHRIPKA
jgi:hypothetical protein